MATILFAGGQGTVARFMGNMVHHLAEHPDTQVQLRDDRSLIPDFIEEMLRYDSPVKLNQRLARRTTTVGGVTIPAGSTILLLLPAGDRDPRHFPCPADFDSHRGNAREHIAFGRGLHSCPGAPLRARRREGHPRADPRPHRRHPHQRHAPRPARCPPVPVHQHLHPARRRRPPHRVHPAGLADADRVSPSPTCPLTLPGARGA